MALNQNLLSLALILALASSAAAQDCGCSSEHCCSQFGYCGTGEPYCGTGCQQGPCSAPSSVSSIVTDNFFDGIIDQAASTCAGKSFYTRSAFLTAVESFSSFGTTGSQGLVTSKRGRLLRFLLTSHMKLVLLHRGGKRSRSRLLCIKQMSMKPKKRNTTGEAHCRSRGTTTTGQRARVSGLTGSTPRNLLLTTLLSPSRRPYGSG